MKTKSVENNSRELVDSLNRLSVLELEQLVALHNRLYFVENSPRISDEAFDKLVLSLQIAKPDSPMLTEVGSAAFRQNDEFGDTVIHRQKMLSLDKCYDDDTFLRWREKIAGSIIAMPKIDGLACSIRYDNSGHLISAATRGDGSQGENITQNVLMISDVPRSIDARIAKNFPDGLEVRGEVYMRLSLFKEKFADSFVNPRNLAAGALKQKNAQRSSDYSLSFFPYDIRGGSFQSEKEKFTLLARIGFTIPDIKELEGNDVNSLYHYYNDERDSLDYEIDGVVFRADLVSEQRRLGDTAHHPRYSIAYKFQGESAQTQVRGIEWSVGRTAIITPICVVDPVFVSGATVTRASLHNVGIFKSHGIREHTLVEIMRRGGVIPYVERVLRAEGEPFLVPEHCPSCGGPVKADADFIYCAQPSTCPKVILARVLHFVSVVDIQGFGSKIVEQLVSIGKVRKAADFYHLNKNDLLSLERLGEKSAQKLLAEIEKKRKLSLSTFITAMGFDEVGPTVALSIAEHFKNLDAILQASDEELEALPGIGVAIAHSLISGIKSYRDEIVALKQVVSIVVEDQSHLNIEHPFYNKNIVFTGAMKLIDRKEAQKQVRAVGAKTPASVSANTDFLVIGSADEQKKASSKMGAVNKLNAKGASITVIDEERFLSMLEAEFVHK